MATPDPLAGLVQAARLSPDNLPLRTHLAESFANLGRFDEAEAEYRSLLAKHPDEPTVLLGMARLYFRQGKTGPATVVLESLIRDADAPAESAIS